MLSALHNDTFIPLAGHMEPYFHFIQYKSPVRRPFCTSTLTIPVAGYSQVFAPESSEVMCVKSLTQGLNARPRKDKKLSLIVTHLITEHAPSQKSRRANHSATDVTYYQFLL